MILIDNASYHSTEIVKRMFKTNGVTFMYTAPYSFNFAPMEKLFGYLKAVNLDPGFEEPTKP